MICLEFWDNILPMIISVIMLMAMVMYQAYQLKKLRKILRSKLLF